MLCQPQLCQPLVVMQVLYQDGENFEKNPGRRKNEYQKFIIRELFFFISYSKLKVQASL